MSDKNWFPSRLADQDAIFTNINGKIAGYETVLPITTARRDQILLIHNDFMALLGDRYALSNG